MILAAEMLPPWLVVPPALVLVIAVGAHMMAMRRSEMPESRRRLRTANGLLMLITTPLTAYAFCRVSSSEPRLFVIVWTAVVGLVGLVVALAVADILNNLWIAHRTSRDLSSRMRAVQLALLEHARRRTDSAPHDPGSPQPGSSTSPGPSA